MTATAPAIWPQLNACDFSLAHIDAGGVSTRVLDAGDGAPLVLLHGTGGHIEAYARNVAALAPDHRVVVIDMLGHGWTDAPPRPYTLDAYAEHLDAVLDALEIERAYLSGESLGGWLAAWYAASRPDRVDRLVLTTPGNVTSKPETMRAVAESTMRAVAEASHETVRARLEWLFAPGNRGLVTDELVDVRLAIYTRPGALEAMRNVLVLQDPDVRARYAWAPSWCGRIACPTLIVWTSDDPTGGLDEGRLLREWIPGARLVCLEGAGHWPQWELPETFDALHRDFLSAAAPADLVLDLEVTA